MNDNSVAYYLFIEGKPYNYFDSEEEAMQELNDWMVDHGVDSVSFDIKPFIEFNEDFPCPYDDYDE